MPLSFRDRVVSTVKAAVAGGLYFTGLLGLILRRRLRGRAVVLMYHRVLTPEQQQLTASQPGLIVGDATFRRHLAVLKRHLAVLTAGEFLQHLERRVPFARPSCLITFDDGWIDNLQNALPALRQEGLPALMFLPVRFIGTRRLFTREAMTHLLVRAVHAVRTDPSRVETLRADLTPLALQHVLDITDPDPRLRIIEAIRVHRYANGPEFEALVGRLCATLGVVESELSPLDTFVDWDQVAAMAAERLDFGGHGADHRVLSLVPPEIVRDEVETSKSVLDSRLASAALTFAYPNGGWNRSVADTVRQCGYRAAFTIDPGYVSCDDDPMTLRRVAVHDDITRTTPMFLARLAGVF